MEEIKAMLLQEKEKILGELEGTIHESSIQAHEIGDDIDNSVVEQEREFQILLQDRYRYKLLQIEDAIKRMEEDEYGYCEECGDAIGAKRLMVVPFTRMCIHCQQEQERVTGRFITTTTTMGEMRPFGDD